MDIEALRSFIAFVDTGSFTRAAKQTFRTQSAISMQMKRLEEDIGHALFMKEGRNLRLTEQGQQLVSSSSATAIKSLLRQGLGISAMALSSVSYGLTIIDANHLPALPSVDIVLSVASIPHPAFGVHLAVNLSQRFFESC